MRSHHMRALADGAYKSNVVITGTAYGATSATIPTHAIGDLIIIAVARISSVDAAITVPGGWTLIPGAPSISGTVTSGPTSARRSFYYKTAASTSETTGTWTNATQVAVVVVQGQNVTTPFGNLAAGTSAYNALSATYNTIAITSPSRANRLLGIVLSNSSTLTVETPPSGMIYHSSSTSDAVHSLSRAGAWPSTVCNYSGGAGMIITQVIEILSS